MAGVYFRCDLASGWPAGLRHRELPDPQRRAPAWKTRHAVAGRPARDPAVRVRHGPRQPAAAGVAPFPRRLRAPGGADTAPPTRRNCGSANAASPLHTAKRMGRLLDSRDGRGGAHAADHSVAACPA
ncbi:hypothetical protein LV779_12610 [Streptomyces thinghirensis]|nr:hypothetical protein [Streptomyces thinghirensis]